jgi:uncharacterized protein YcnI
VFGFANVSAAHVNIDPKEAMQGGYATMVFRMPNERDDASTVKLEVYMPTEHPIASVRTMDVPGWKIKIKMRKLDKPIDAHGRKIDEVVGTITWTANKGHALKPMKFMQFPVSMGRLPEVDSLTFKTIQTYDNGEVVRWIEEATEGGEEPEKPAPVLKLTKPSAENAVQPLSAGNPAAAGPAKTIHHVENSGTPMWLGIVGLIIGLIGFAFGGVAFARTRSTTQA